MQGTDTVSKARLWTGWVLTGLFALFMLADGVSHVLKPAPVVEAFSKLGIPLSAAVGLGVVQLLCLGLYVLPRTAVLGAALLTGYLGGAVAIHLHAQDGMFPLLFPVLLGVLMWAGVAARRPAVQRMLLGSA